MESQCMRKNCSREISAPACVPSSSLYCDSSIGIESIFSAQVSRIAFRPPLHTATSRFVTSFMSSWNRISERATKWIRSAIIFSPPFSAMYFCIANRVWFPDKTPHCPLASSITISESMAVLVSELGEVVVLVFLPLSLAPLIEGSDLSQAVEIVEKVRRIAVLGGKHDCTLRRRPRLLHHQIVQPVRVPEGADRVELRQLDHALQLRRIHQLGVLQHALRFDLVEKLVLVDRAGLEVLEGLFQPRLDLLLFDVVVGALRAAECVGHGHHRDVVGVRGDETKDSSAMLLLKAVLTSTEGAKAGARRTSELLDLEVVEGSF
mmetsp:Transcript_1557/g.3671  ORF Transcript_1557/g.3671 Transcript_1557/m.3671 type:complete len:320 (-) Transcript_1557:159-1118(-)